MRSNLSNIRKSRVVVTLLIAIASAVPFGVQASAQSVATIEFLNPSSFSAVPAPQSPDPSVPKGPDTIIVSDMPAGVPDGGPEAYRLSAWVSTAPQNPAVEFELLTRGGVSLEVIDDVRRVGADTFEADWDIPDTLPDGPYTIRATLAEGILAVDNVDQDIVIDRVAERADILYPDTRSSNGQFGMYIPITAANTSSDAQAAPSNPVGNIETRTTGSDTAPGSGPGHVRVFYTTSLPGTTPDWRVCGTEWAVGSFPFNDAEDGVRCVLNDPSHQQLITAVAIAANTSKLEEPHERNRNQAGDATRVVDPYAQVPTKLEVVEGQSATLDSGGECHEVVAELTDQFGHEVLAANMDAHAWGPTDRLRFGTGIVDSWDLLPPDRANHSREMGYDCFSSTDDNTETTGDQGEHQVIGGPDLKHIEVDANGPGSNGDDGTDDNGQWGFLLFLPEDQSTTERHTTYWEVWLDENNDGSGSNNDKLDTIELCRSGLIGWDAPASTSPMPGVTPSCADVPPPPDCDEPTPDVEACPTTSPSPSPSTSPSPEPTNTDPPEDSSITMKAAQTQVERGKRVRFSGVVDGSPECTVGREVLLQSKRRGGKFRTKTVTTTSSDGSWSAHRRIKRTKVWRAVAKSAAACPKLRSDTVTVRVSRT